MPDTHAQNAHQSAAALHGSELHGSELHGLELHGVGLTQRATSEVGVTVERHVTPRQLLCIATVRGELDLAGALVLHQCLLQSPSSQGHQGYQGHARRSAAPAVRTCADRSISNSTTSPSPVDRSGTLLEAGPDDRHDRVGRASWRNDWQTLAAWRSSGTLAMDFRREALIPHVIVDLEGVTFLDASGIGVLVFLHQALAGASDRLALCCAHDQPRYVMHLTEVDKFLSLHETFMDALMGMRSTV